VNIDPSQDGTNIRIICACVYMEHQCHGGMWERLPGKSICCGSKKKKMKKIAIYPVDCRIHWISIKSLGEMCIFVVLTVAKWKNMEIDVHFSF
jgi:hypothetical protein